MAWREVVTEQYIHGKNVEKLIAPDDKAIERDARFVKRFRVEIRLEASLTCTINVGLVLL
jgi:hypothetical protein